MQDIKIYQEIKIKKPVMFAAWPGMGNVALGAIDYLRKKMKATLFAEIDIGRFIIHDSIIIEKGIAKLPYLPKNLFYYLPEPELIIFEGESQLIGTPGLKLVDLILNFAEEYKVQRIYTGAAFPCPMNHNERSSLYATANSAGSKDFLEKKGIEVLGEGQISGLNGLLVGFAKLRQIEAACLLATIPFYAINFPNPKASKLLLEMFMKILNLQTLDFKDLDRDIKKMNSKMKEIEEKIKDIFPLKKEDKTQIKEEKAPHYVIEKVEKLFQEARIDKEKAYLLKEELDRWNLYKLYEDKFLDLFRKHH
ncbi:PAC2 family protein [bacterium]|nr:PAC2 family protein [bacterium]